MATSFLSPPGGLALPSNISRKWPLPTTSASSPSPNRHHFAWIILIASLPTTVDSFAQKPERILKNISQVKLLLCSKHSGGFTLLADLNPNSSPWRYRPSMIRLLTALLASSPTTFPLTYSPAVTSGFCSSLNVPSWFYLGVFACAGCPI